MPEVISRDSAKAQGLPRFFTGKACKHGHLAQRYVSGRVCCECQKVNSRKFATRHPERVERSRSIQRAKSPSYFKDYYRLNAERRKGETKGWYEANKDRHVEVCRAWIELNRDKRRSIGRISRRKRRAREFEAGGSHTREDLERIYQQQRGKCAACKCSLANARKEVDHIVPLSRGGHNNPSNLQYLCRSCNRAKSAKDPIEFAQELGLLL